MNTIGVVGLGTMGSRIAARLLDTGFQVHATNRTPSRAQALIKRGLRWEDTPRAVAAAADVVLSMVTDDDALRAVTAGQDGILAGMAPGSIYVDMSSVSPQVSLEVSQQVRDAGGWMLDAPVSGSVPQVEHGNLAIMVGGDEAAFRRVEPVLSKLGHPVTRVGGNGKGVLLKLAINISLAVQTLVFSEGLLLAERGGIDATLAATVMAASSIGSPLIAGRVPMLLDLPAVAWFDVQLLHKDVRLALEQAQRAHIALPSTVTADRVLGTATDMGFAHRDIAALHEVLAQLNPATDSARADGTRTPDQSGQVTKEHS